MAKSRKGNDIQKTLSFLVYGEQGTWKSSIGAEALALKNPDGSPMKVLIIDSEFGGIDTALEKKAEQYGFNPENAYIIYTESYTEVMELLDKAKKNEPFYYYDEEGEEIVEDGQEVKDADGNIFNPDFIVLDGSTVIYNASSIALTKFSEKRAKVKAKAQNKTTEETLVAVQGAGLELKDYNKLNKERSQELILKLIATGKHHYITAREVDEKKSVKTDDGKIQSVPTGKKLPDGFKGMGYNVGTVLRLFINDFGEVNAYVENKDRTGTFAQNVVIENPSLTMWQSVIDNNKGKNKIEMNPSFKESIEKEYNQELEDNHLNENDDNMSAEDYYTLIKEKLSALPKDKKQLIGNKIKTSGLPMKYESLTDIEQLKKYVQIVSE